MSSEYYAALDKDGNVMNIVVGNDGGLAEALLMMLPKAANVVQVTEDMGTAYIGGDLRDGRFRAPKPYPSWVWDESIWSWAAPVAYPNDDKTYTWDESNGQWVALSEEESDPHPDTE